MFPFLLSLILCTGVYAQRLELTLTQAQKAPWPISLDVAEGVSETIVNVLEQDIKLSGVLTHDPSHAQVVYRVEPCKEGVCVGHQGQPTATAVTGDGSDVMLAHHLMDYIMQDALGTPGWFHHRLVYVVTSGNNMKDRNYHLEVSDILGRDVQTVFQSHEPIMSPAWSHDGQKIAYVSFEKYEPSLWVQDLQSGQREMVSGIPGINGAPAWSPDDKTLALVLTKTGTPKLYTLNLASAKLSQLTSGRGIDTEPQWSQDGQSVVFTSNRSGTPQIYRYHFQDQSIDRLTYQGGSHVRPTLSTNGKMVTLAKDMRWGVMYHDLQQESSRLISASGSEDQPMIHPQGYLVIYTKRFGSQTMLEIAHVSDPIRYRLPAKSGFIRFPTWSHS